MVLKRTLSIAKAPDVVDEEDELEKFKVWRRGDLSFSPNAGVHKKEKLEDILFSFVRLGCLVMGSLNIVEKCLMSMSGAATKEPAPERCSPWKPVTVQDLTCSLPGSPFRRALDCHEPISWSGMMANAQFILEGLGRLLRQTLRRRHPLPLSCFLHASRTLAV